MVSESVLKEFEVEVFVNGKDRTLVFKISEQPAMQLKTRMIRP